MNMTDTAGSGRQADGRARRLLARMNMTLFYCVGAAVLLETAAETRRQIRRSVEDSRRDDGAAHVAWLRAYASSVWPEFGWEAACAAMSGDMQGVSCADGLTPAHAAAIAERRAFFYRLLARIADEPGLRDVLEAMGSAHPPSQHGARPGRGDQHVRGVVAGVRFARSCINGTRSRAVRRAFHLLQQNWSDGCPFPPIEYDAFVERAAKLLLPVCGLRGAGRWLVRWSLRRSVRPDARSPARVGAQGDSGASRRAGPPGEAHALPHTAALR